MNVFDANVLVSGLRSDRGASHVVIREMIQARIDFAVSPAVAFEYEEVLKRPGILGSEPWIAPHEIDVVLDALLASAVLVFPRYRFRPFLEAPDDDLYIECALAAGATTIVTRDRHFDVPAARAFGLRIVETNRFLAEHRKRSEEK